MILYAFIFALPHTTTIYVYLLASLIKMLGDLYDQHSVLKVLYTHSPAFSTFFLLLILPTKKSCNACSVVQTKKSVVFWFCFPFFFSPFVSPFLRLLFLWIYFLDRKYEPARMKRTQSAQTLHTMIAGKITYADMYAKPWRDHIRWKSFGFFLVVEE